MCDTSFWGVPPTSKKVVSGPYGHSEAGRFQIREPAHPHPGGVSHILVIRGEGART